MSHPLEWWGGIECTVNRTRHGFLDQLELSGHHARSSDLDLVAELGLRKLRYPVLWERCVDGRLDRFDFSWADQRLERLRELGLDVVLGLVHHGSGPRGTHLLDPYFGTGLARFAECVARRYPWVQDFTPVNEPLTTARFSALYGHWYPHASDPRDFARAVLNQVRAVKLAMRAIRTVIPGARLVQTEDIGTVFSTPRLAYQAEFENLRRWLSLDLLFGFVVPGHGMYDYLVEAADVSASELAEFSGAPCPPDVIGVNYYVTSDRFLDERLALYPPDVHGGNGQDRYADVEAVRVVESGIVGHQRVLELVWERYRTPLVVSEVHLGCCPEQQLCWLLEAQVQAQQARANGVDVRALTAWSLFGAHGWNRLLTEGGAHYEPGAFDVSGGEPRPTLVASALRDLARGAETSGASAPAWWRSPKRLLYPL